MSAHADPNIILSSGQFDPAEGTLSPYCPGFNTALKWNVCDSEGDIEDGDITFYDAATDEKYATGLWRFLDVNGVLDNCETPAAVELPMSFPPETFVNGFDDYTFEFDLQGTNSAHELSNRLESIGVTIHFVDGADAAPTLSSASWYPDDVYGYVGRPCEDGGTCTSLNITVQDLGNDLAGGWIFVYLHSEQNPNHESETPFALIPWIALGNDDDLGFACGNPLSLSWDWRPTSGYGATAFDTTFTFDIVAVDYAGLTSEWLRDVAALTIENRAIPTECENFGCLINGVCYDDEEENPLDSCQICDETRRFDWSFNNDDIACVCDTETQCLIDDVCYLPGNENLTGQCEVCDPSASASDWTVLDCPDLCPSGCEIGGVCYDDQEHNPNQYECKICDVSQSRSEWTNTGECLCECVIDGYCYEYGDFKGNGDVCCPEVDRYAWTDDAACESLTDWEVGYGALHYDGHDYAVLLFLSQFGPARTSLGDALTVGREAIDGQDDFHFALVHFVSGAWMGVWATMILPNDDFASNQDLQNYLEMIPNIESGDYVIDAHFYSETNFTSHGLGHDYTVSMPESTSVISGGDAHIVWLAGAYVGDDDTDDDTTDDDTSDDDTSDDDTADDDTGDVWEIGYGPLVRDEVEYPVVIVAPVLGPAETVYGTPITVGLDFLDGEDDLRFALVRFTDGELEGINATMILGDSVFESSGDLADYFDAAPNIGPDAYAIDAFYTVGKNFESSGAGHDFVVTLPADAELMEGTSAYIDWIGGEVDDDTSDDDTEDIDWEIGWGALNYDSVDYPIFFVVYQVGPAEVFYGDPVTVGSDVIDGTTDFHYALVRFVDGTLEGLNLTMLLSNGIFDTVGELADYLEASPDIEPGDFVVDADFVGDAHFAAQGMGYDYAVVLPQNVSLLTGASAYIHWIGVIDDIEVDVLLTDIATEEPIEDAECVVVDNSTGEPLDPEISAISDEYGHCTMMVPENTQDISIAATKSGYVPMYRYNLPSWAPIDFMMVGETMADDLATATEVTPDPEDGMVLGIAFWATISGSGGVGCAVVTNDSGQNVVYYIGDSGISSTRGGTWPDSPGFFLFNVPAGGPYEFTATADLATAEETIPQIIPDAVTFVLLMFNDETNPTPLECE